MAEQPRLDTELVRRGLARSRVAARRAIEAGLVSVDGRTALKPSTPVTDAARLEVSGGDHYVARSAHKLLAALDGFGISVAGRSALDVGASTGGFTQVLLERGADHVVALDVGHGQLDQSLRSDARVTVLEGVNARELDADRLAALSGRAERPELVVADLSFIPLGLVLPALAATAAPSAELVLLVKPQFEVGRTGVREGIVRDIGARRDAVDGVAWAAWDLGLRPAGVMVSPVVGEHGNQEYLLRLGPGGVAEPGWWTASILELP